MGNEQSSSDQGAPLAGRPPLRRLASRSADPEGTFVLVTNESAEVFHYDPDQTRMVAYGINEQTYPKFSDRTLKKSGLAALQVSCSIRIMLSPLGPSRTLMHLSNYVRPHYPKPGLMWGIISLVPRPWLAPAPIAYSIGTGRVRSRDFGPLSMSERNVDYTMTS